MRSLLRNMTFRNCVFSVFLCRAGLFQKLGLPVGVFAGTTVCGMFKLDWPGSCPKLNCALAAPIWFIPEPIDAMDWPKPDRPNDEFVTLLAILWPIKFIIPFSSGSGWNVFVLWPMNLLVWRVKAPKVLNFIWNNKLTGIVKERKMIQRLMRVGGNGKSTMLILTLPPTRGNR